MERREIDSILIGSRPKISRPDTDTRNITRSYKRDTNSRSSVVSKYKWDTTHIRLFSTALCRIRDTNTRRSSIISTRFLKDRIVSSKIGSLMGRIDNIGSSSFTQACSYGISIVDHTKGSGIGRCIIERSKLDSSIESITSFIISTWVVTIDLELCICSRINPWWWWSRACIKHKCLGTCYKQVGL